MSGPFSIIKKKKQYKMDKIAELQKDETAGQEGVLAANRGLMKILT